MLGSFFWPMHAGLLTSEATPHLPLIRKDTTASYSMPTSSPEATVSCAGAFMAVPPQRYQFWSPVRRNFTVVDLASSGSSHLTFSLPSSVGSMIGTSAVGPSCITSIMPPASDPPAPATVESLAMEYSPKPSALRQHTAASYSTPSSARTVHSRRDAAKVVLPEVTNLPLAASTRNLRLLVMSCTSTWDASTGGQARGTTHVHLIRPGPMPESFGGPGFGGFSRGFSSPVCPGLLGCESSPQPSEFIAATTAS
mmetsp:Transcript_14771/g.44371  ORF Transcript_14771/g.44371 Transcript_14771/m.44371 type:complete len:253 (-) Transcript_14771:306-1064(-)